MTYTFIDLFAGIGGVRKGFEDTGRFRCIFSSEKDVAAARTYQANFGDDPLGDVTQIDPDALPDFDVMTAGFPCQAFSQAGKKMGFKDTRGTLFFDVARLAQAKTPKVIFLENVKGLLSHDKGRTLAVITDVLSDIGYHVHTSLLNAVDYGLPQRRERIYVVATKCPMTATEWVWAGKDPMFSFPLPTRETSQLSDVLESGVGSEYFVSKNYLAFMKRHRAKHAAAGHGFGYVVLDPKSYANTLVCGGMGRERNLVVDHGIPCYYPDDRNTEHIRMLTPREWARLQGFPDDFELPKAPSAARKQLGNSVAVPVVRAIAHEVAKMLDNWSYQLGTEV